MKKKPNRVNVLKVSLRVIFNKTVSSFFAFGKIFELARKFSKSKISASLKKYSLVLENSSKSFLKNPTTTQVNACYSLFYLLFFSLYTSLLYMYNYPFPILYRLNWISLNSKKNRLFNAKLRFLRKPSRFPSAEK